MMMIKGETDKDVSNVEAWAEVIEDLLHCVPHDRRADVLTLAVKSEEVASARREKNGGWNILGPAELKEWENSPGLEPCGSGIRP